MFTTSQITVTRAPTAPTAGYAVYRNKRRMFKGDMFTTYEQARQRIRKWIRAKMDSYDYQMWHDALWDSTSRNPTNISTLGFRIKRVG